MMLGAGASEDMGSGWIMLAGVLWSLTLSLFLLFNRDRMRMGDLIAGTWVVMAQRAKLDADIAVDAAGGAMIFTEAELPVSGIFGLTGVGRVAHGRGPARMREGAAATAHQNGGP